MNHLGFTVIITLDKYRRGSIFGLYSGDFGSDDIGGFIPGDSLVLALASILGITFPVRVPVYPP